MKLSELAKTLFEAPRSWPVFIYKGWATGPHQDAISESFRQFSTFCLTGKFALCQGKAPVNMDLAYQGAWSIGRFLRSTQFLNVIMESNFQRDQEAEDLWKRKGSKGPLLRAEEFSPNVYLCMRLFGEEHQGQKLASYIIDKLIWDATTLSGFFWLNCFTSPHSPYNEIDMINMVAKPVREAIKKPNPDHPPWHPSNRHKYIVSENSEDVGHPKRKADSGLERPEKRQRKPLPF